MAKVFIEETTLTAIGDAIREKEGTTELVPVNDMATRIINISSGGGGTEVEPIVLSGSCSYACSGAIAETFIKNYPTKVSTKDVTDIGYMFYYTKLEEIPFQINVSNVTNLVSAFQTATFLKVCPKIRGSIKWNTSTTIANILNNCARLRDIEDLFTPEMIEGSSTVKITSAYSCPKPCNMNALYSLRRLPSWFYAFRLSPESTAVTTTSYSPYYYMLYNATTLDEALDIPVHVGQNLEVTTNMFGGTLDYASHLKNFTFELNPDTGAPYVVKWKNQLLDFNNRTGWGSSYYDFTGYNSGITVDKLITAVYDDDGKYVGCNYESLKDDPDWFATQDIYSRYSHDSAVRTINSLPDASAYLASSGGTNTIKFKGIAGRDTGGAINTLTAEEIAVATAKGWTVTLA